MDSDSSADSHSNSGSSPGTASVKGSESDSSVGSPENQEEVESDASNPDSPNVTVIENQVASPAASDHSVASPGESDNSAASPNPDNDTQESEKEETQVISDESAPASPDDGTKSNGSGPASPNGSVDDETKSNTSVASPSGSVGSREDTKSNVSVASPDGSEGSTSVDENVENGDQNVVHSDGSGKSRKKEKVHRNNDSKPENGIKKSDFVDDISDVSEGDSDDGLGAFGDESPPKNNVKIPKNASLKIEAEEEQLDFEVEEEGECDGKFQDDKSQNGKQKDSDLEDGEISDDGETRTEEEPKPICKFYTRGHCTWGTNCRFIHPGVPDKGNYTMFEPVRPMPHATTVHAPPPMPGPMLYPMVPPHVLPPVPERPVVPAVAPIGLKKDDPMSESSWERGLRQAKEMIRKSSKRKESDVDFHDKKMNLTIQQQEEAEKETEFYPKKSKSPRPSRSPDRMDEKWKENDKHHGRIMHPEHGPPPGDLLPPHMEHPHPMGYYPHPMPPHVMPRPEYWMPPHRMPYDELAMRGPQFAMPPYADYYGARRYLPPNSYYPPRHGMMGVPPMPSPHPPPEYYDRKHNKHRSYTSSGREVIIQKSDKSYKDESPGRHRRREESPRTDRRADEWSDPWMRSKSPHSRRRHRRESSSTKSSYSSSSRSSSRSSYERRSKLPRNKNKSNSSSSPSPTRNSNELKNRKRPIQFKQRSPPPSRPQTFANRRGMKTKSPSVQLDRRMVQDRITHFVPSASPKSPREPSLTGPNPSPPVANRRNASRRMKPSIAVGSSRSLSKSSTSSSSSSESSGSSASSASSSSGASKSSGKSVSPPPPARVRKTYLNDQSLSAPTAPPKSKTVESKVAPGTKPGIKLTLKGNAGALKRSVELNSSALRKAGKKRSVPSNSGSDSDYGTAKKSSRSTDGKGTPTRREELLKQLKAVEDAIAKKRSKVQ